MYVNKASEAVAMGGEAVKNYGPKNKKITVGKRGCKTITKKGFRQLIGGSWCAAVASYGPRSSSIPCLRPLALRIICALLPPR